MPVRSIWSNVGVAVQSALGSGQDVSAITKANPGVLTYVGADPTEDSYVLLLGINGMVQVDERVFRANNVNAGGNTLELEGEDTTLYDTLVASTAAMYPITFGTNLRIVQGITASGGEPEEVDGTTIHDTTRQIQYGVFSASQFSMDCLWDPADAGLIALKQASKLKAKRAFHFSWPNGYRHLFYGLVAAIGDPIGTAQGLVTTPVKITRVGAPTFYAA